MSLTGEKQLVEQAKTDPRAFGRLYDRYLDRIYSYAYRQTGNVMVAQDITAVTFEKALRHIRRHRWQEVSFGAWPHDHPPPCRNQNRSPRFSAAGHHHAPQLPVALPTAADS